MSLPTLKLVVVASVLALVALLPPCGAQLKGGGSGLGIALMQQEQEAAEIEIQVRRKDWGCGGLTTKGAQRSAVE